MGEIIVTIITVIIAGILSGGATSYFLVKSSNKKNDAEATEKMVDTAMSLIEPLKKRISELEPLIPQVKKLDNLSKRQTRFIQQLLDGIRQLIEQIEKRDGEKPCWTPDDIVDEDWPPEDKSMEDFEYDT